MQNSTLVWIILVALVVLGGGWYFFSMQEPAAGENEEALTEEPTESPDEPGGTSVGAGVDVEVGGGGSEESTAPLSATITYSANGFAPSTVTVKKGGTVTWRNQGSSDMWVASAQHPTHTAYSGTTLQEHCDDAVDTSLDQCDNGAIYSFTFDKVGTWRYHNHSNSSHFGTVIVEE